MSLTGRWQRQCRVDHENCSGGVLVMITDTRVLVLPSPTTSWSGGARRRTRRPLVGVVFNEEASGEEAFALDLAIAVDAAGGDVLGVACSSPTANDFDFVRALVRCQQGGVEVLVTTVPVWLGEPVPTTWPCLLADLDVPFLQLPSSATASRGWPSEEGWSTPGPGTGDEETGGLAGLVLRTARLRRRSNAHKRVVIAVPAPGGEEDRWRDATASISGGSVLALLYALRHAGFRVDHIPPDADSLVHAMHDAARPSGSRTWPVSTFSGMGDLARLDLGGVLVTVGPACGWSSEKTSAWGSAQPLALAFGRRLAQAWGADVVVHLGDATMLQWLPGRSGASLAPCCCDSDAGGVITVVDLQEAARFSHFGHSAVVLALSPPTTWWDRP